MDAAQPAFLLREARVTDHRRLLRLARELNSINLPTDSAEMTEMLARSAKSFRGQVANRARAVYIFCAEEISTRAIAGASMGLLGMEERASLAGAELEILSEPGAGTLVRVRFLLSSDRAGT